jgi:branched-chain amino acid transport system substrate-binding protein
MMTSPRARARRIAAFCLLISSTVAAISCSDEPTAPSASQDIVIGGLFSLTGNWASLGVASKAAMEIGIEDVNQYLADGGSGLHFTASIKDTKLDAATALAQVTELKTSGVEVVIGPQSSAEVAALKS